MGVDCDTAPGPRPTVLFNATVSTSATQFVSNMELVLNVPVDMVVVVNVTQLNNSSAMGPLNAVVFYLTNQNGDLNRHDMTDLEKSLIDVSPTLLSSLNALFPPGGRCDGDKRAAADAAVPRGRLGHRVLASGDCRSGGP
jgi:hypothetical protein